MIADLYICDRAFSYNGADTIDDIRLKISNIGDLLGAIRRHSDENMLYVQKENFLGTVFLPGGTCMRDFIFITQRGRVLKDMSLVLLSLFKSASRCEHSHDMMVSTLDKQKESQDHCNGLIAMNEIDGIEESCQVLQKRADFFEFRRHFIAKYPKDPKTFLINIDKYFDKIVLNKDRAFMESQVGDVIHRAKDIVDGLSALNEHFISEYQNSAKDGLNTLDNFLDAFATRHSIDGGSSEGSNKKDELYCDFDGWEGKHYCGPHLKFWPDTGKKKKDHLRIYFCWDDNNLEKVYVGLICQHVKDSKGRGRHKNHKK